MTTKWSKDDVIRTNIQLRMTQLGVNGADVARMLGVKRQALNQRLRGKGKLTRGTVALMAIALVVPVEALRATSPTLTVAAPVPSHADWRLIVSDAIADGEPYPSIDDLLLLTTSTPTEETPFNGIQEVDCG